MSLEGIALISEQERQRMLFDYSGGFADEPSMDVKAEGNCASRSDYSGEELDNSCVNENPSVSILKFLLGIECIDRCNNCTSEGMGSVFFLSVGFVQAATKG